MSEDATPISYLALQAGTPVLAQDGSEFGTVEAVLVVEEVDVFDGVVVSTPAGSRFVDADHVASITTAQVLTTLTSQEASELPEPGGTPIYKADARDDTGSSISDRFGRVFGRGKWRSDNSG